MGEKWDTVGISCLECSLVHVNGYDWGGLGGGGEVTLMVTNKEQLLGERKWFRPKLKSSPTEGQLTAPSSVWPSTEGSLEKRRWREVFVTWRVMQSSYLVGMVWSISDVMLPQVNTFWWALGWAELMSQVEKIIAENGLVQHDLLVVFTTWQGGIRFLLSTQAWYKCQGLWSPRFPCYEEGQRSEGWQMRNETSSRRDRLGLLCGSIRCPWQFSQQ